MSEIPYDPEAAYLASELNSQFVDRGYSNSGLRNPQVYNDNSDEEIGVDVPIPEVDQENPEMI